VTTQEMKSSAFKGYRIPGLNAVYKLAGFGIDSFENRCWLSSFIFSQVTHHSLAALIESTLSKQPHHNPNHVVGTM
jgi:hypothetical protein